MNRDFGRYAAPDERDKLYKMRRKSVPSPLKTKKWRLGPATDQFETPHCVGHAFYNLFGAEPIRQVVMPPQGIYYFAQLEDEWEGNNYDGTSVRGGAKAMSHAGYLREYRWAFDLDTMARHILTTGPVVIGTNWYAGMDDPEKDGTIRVKGRLHGGHAYLGFGVDMRRGFLWIRNSWSSEWGVSGNAKIYFDDFERLIKEEGEILSPIKQKIE